MKRLIVLLAALMLCAAPAFAAEKGKMSNVTTKTDIQNSTLANIGQGNEMNVGNVKNQGGTMNNVSTETTLKNSNLVNIGKDNKMNVGTVSNQ